MAWARREALSRRRREALRAAADGVKELFGGKGFGEVIDGAGFDGLDGQLGRGVGGDHEDRDIGPAFGGGAEELVAAHAAEGGRR